MYLAYRAKLISGGIFVVLISRSEAARRLNIKPSSLADKRYRARIGLQVVKIGRSVKFLESDIERLIKRGHEKLPMRSGGDGN